MANNLKDHLKEVADAIRAKKGTSELINPQDFATEIEGISGSGEGGGSNWMYFKFGENASMKNIILSSLATTVKGGYEGEGTVIVFPYGAKDSGFIVSAFAFFADAYVIVDGNKMKTGEAYANILGMLPNYGVETISEEEYFTI